MTVKHPHTAWDHRLPMADVVRVVLGWVDTVDGRNPAPPGMYKTLQILGETTYQPVQDFSHRRYQYMSFL